MKISVVIPTYNEKDNIVKLLPKLDNVLCGLDADCEIVVVDDSSPDGTFEEVLKLAELIRTPVTAVRREKKKGLSSALLDGFRVCIGDIFVVMDADMSHNPDDIPRLVKAVFTGDAGICVGSRFAPGSKFDYPLLRKVASKIAVKMCHMLLPCTKRVSDPLSGFFAVKKDCVRFERTYKPRGFKFLLDILVRTNCTATEQAISFKPRVKGKSKLGIKQIFEFAFQVILSVPLCLKLGRV